MGGECHLLLPNGDYQLSTSAFWGRGPYGFRNLGTGGNGKPVEPVNPHPKPYILLRIWTKSASRTTEKPVNRIILGLLRWCVAWISSSTGCLWNPWKSGKPVEPVNPHPKPDKNPVEPKSPPEYRPESHLVDVNSTLGTKMRWVLR